MLTNSGNFPAFLKNQNSRLPRSGGAIGGCASSDALATSTLSKMSLIHQTAHQRRSGAAFFNSRAHDQHLETPEQQPETDLTLLAPLSPPPLQLLKKTTF